jgi:hypothetical protein
MDGGSIDKVSLFSRAWLICESAVPGGVGSGVSSGVMGKAPGRRLTVRFGEEVTCIVTGGTTSASLGTCFCIGGGSI